MGARDGSLESGASVWAKADHIPDNKRFCFFTLARLDFICASQTPGCFWHVNGINPFLNIMGIDTG
jgi:hypothetical protein